MVAILRHQVAASTIERISNRTPPAGIGDIDPKLQTLFLDVAIEIEVADAGLDQRVGVLLIDLQDPIHAFQIEHDTAGIDWRCAAVAEVLSGGNRIDGDLEGVGDAYDFLYLFDVVRGHGGGSDQFIRFAPERGVGVAIQSDIFVAGENPFLAHGLFKLLQCSSEITLTHTRRNSHLSSEARLGTPTSRTPTVLPIRSKNRFCGALSFEISADANWQSGQHFAGSLVETNDAKLYHDFGSSFHFCFGMPDDTFPVVSI